MIYADFNGSAPLNPDVREYLIKRLQDGPFANPNSIHSLGKKMMFGIEKCRRSLAKNLGASPDQLIFNSGASEGLTQIVHSVLGCAPTGNKNIIVTSGIEHSCLVECCKLFAKKGYDIQTVRTASNGVIELEHLKEIIKTSKDKIALISIMAANNETGVIQPIKEIGQLAKDSSITFLSDTTQLIGKIEFSFSDFHMDYAVMSSHKIGALIGSGAIIAKDPTTLKPFVLGGGQERGLRAGTQNYIGIETMAVAMDSFTKDICGLKDVKNARETFEKNIKEKFPRVVIIGQDAPRLAATTLISYPGIHGQAVQIELESQDIFVTTSSACSDNEPETSKVLRSMSISDDVGRGVVRISLCCGADSITYQKIEDALTNAYKKLEKIQGF